MSEEVGRDGLGFRVLKSTYQSLMIDRLITFLKFLVLGFLVASPVGAEVLPLEKGNRVVLIGNGLGSRMMQFGYFETEVQRRNSGKELIIRNMCDEGNTPGFRPHSARPSPWAFPGAEKYRPVLSKVKDRWGSGNTGNGIFETPDQWLSKLKADVIVGFFGFNESFNGLDGIESFEGELRDFIRHTRSQKYNGSSAPRLALVSPIAFENLSASHGTPDGLKQNANLALYTAAMKKVTVEERVPFVDLFQGTLKWYAETSEPLTQDGALLADSGYRKLAPVLATALFGKSRASGDSKRVLAAVQEKDWMWHKYYKIPNGVHVYGRRMRPYGPVNYPSELQKLAEMTANRDAAIHATLSGKSYDLAAADAKTSPLAEVKSNYRPSNKNGTLKYHYGEEALATMKVAEGYRIDLFASEKEFENLANPVQMSFDNQGRLWVATMPTYPHYKPGNGMPSDKLLILEDTDGDGKADKETVFVDDLHLPTGFELAHDGVYVAQGNHLILFKDTNGDDKVDEREVILSGFDDHDTHHVISAFCADPSGAIFMGEGTFLHSNVETAYGPERSSNGGFFRYQPNRRHLERTARISIPNPWGTAFDQWGQPFFLDTSDPNMRWMRPGTNKVRYGDFSPLWESLIEKAHRVRPTSGLEFVASRHFPDEVQGDLLFNNTIGYLGIKQHTLEDSGTGYSSKHRQDLLTSTDGNFRPVDLEFAPDGSLYLLDWHNVLVGHMQHSARDPYRDHKHGRVYRITYPSRPLLKPVSVKGAELSELLDHLKLPEDRVRYRVRRELRGRPVGEVSVALKTWLKGLDASDPRVDHHRLEALWVGWGLNQVDADLLKELLVSKNHRVRAAAVNVLRYSGHQIAEQADLLMKAANDPEGRVRLEAITAASWLEPSVGLLIVEAAGKLPQDRLLKPVYETALSQLKGLAMKEEAKEKMRKPTKPLKGEAKRLYVKGAEVYGREGHCTTCHQPDGEGLPAAMFPPLSETKWVNGSDERLIKLTLHGLMGPIEIKGKKYPGQVPMTSFKGLSDEEVAAVLTYVRNTFGNHAPMVTPGKVKEVRKATAAREGFYLPENLLNEHPHD